MKNVQNFERYSIDEYGNLFRGTKKLKPDFSLPYGRLKVYKDNVQYAFYIHRMVAIHFVPNPLNLPEVDHIDNDKRNNHFSNLRWCTHKENLDNFYKNYGYTKDHSKLIERNSKRAKPVGYKLPSGEQIEFPSMAAAEKAGFKKANIFYSIKNGIKHGGHNWYYV